jgi:O-antigen ligase
MRMNFSDAKSANLALTQRNQPEWRWSRFDNFLLLAWIFSHTIVIDIVYELKLFDIISIIAVPRFLSRIVDITRSKDATKKFILVILICVTFGSLLTFAKTVDLQWAAVVVLRWWRLFAYLVIFLLIAYGGFSKSQHEKFISVILMSCVLQALLILLQHMDIVPILWPEDELYYNKVVPSGTLGINHVNHVIYMTVGLGAAVAFSSFSSPRKRMRSAIAMGAAPLLVAAMFVGEARLSFLALAVFGVFLLRRAAGWKFIAVLACMIAVVGIVTKIDVIGMASELWSHQLETKVERREAQGAEGFQAIDPGRHAIFLWTIDTILDRPDYLITGIGYQNFMSAGGPVSAHNTYFQVLVELGLVGFVAWMGLFVAIYRSMSEVERHAGRYERNIMLAGKAALLAVAVSGLFNDTLYPVRNNNGFLGFALVFFAIASSGVWRQTVAQQASRTGPGRGGARRLSKVGSQRDAQGL